MTNITGYLDSKGIKYKPSGNDVIINCPVCGKEKLYINTNTGVHHCFYCDARDPSAVTAKGHINQLKELWGDVLPISSISKKIDPKVEKQSDVDYSRDVSRYHTALKDNKKALRFLLKRGINEQSIDNFKLGFSRQYNQNWLVIPSFEDNKPKLLKFRKLPPDENEDLAKYIRRKGSKSILFNGDAIDEYDELFICEGEIDAITLIQNGYPNTIGITGGAGTLLPEWYDKLILKDKLYLILDSDEAGQKAARDVWATRLGLNKCLNVLLPSGMDINDFFNTKSKEEFDHVLEQAQKFQVKGVITLDDAFQKMYDKHQADEESEKFALPWNSVNRLLGGGIERQRLMVMGGIPGCISGNTKLYIRRGERKGGRVYSIEEIYNKINNICGADYNRKVADGVWTDLPTFTFSLQGDTVNYHKIRNVVYSGVKTTYTVKTDTGNEIRTTLDHKFLTRDFGYQRLNSLKVGDTILLRSLDMSNSRSDGRKIPKVAYSIPFHPFASAHNINGKNYKRTSYARLLVEANMNNLSVEEMIDILRKDKSRSEKLKYLDPHLIVHHKDGNNQNNVISNLEVLTKEEHDRHHGFSHKSHFGNQNTSEERISSIEEFGDEKTYDVIMCDPYRNFVGNNFILHNSGKTSMAIEICYFFARMYNIPSLFFCMEMPEISLAVKVVQLYKDVTINEIDYGNALIYAMELKGLPMYFGYSSKVTPDVFYNTMEAVRNRYGVEFGVFDNLQRMVRSGEEADIGRASGVFKDITMDLNIPFLLISQPRKLNDKSTPTFDDLKGSSAIPADADVVMLLHRNRVKKSTHFSLNPVTQILVDKSRFSSGGKTQLYFDGAKSKFNEMDEHDRKTQA